MTYLLAFHQGTTSSRALILDTKGEVCGVAQTEFKQHFPHPGYVEHNPEDIWSSQYGVANEALAKAGIKSSDIAAIGITNQRETTIVWDRKNIEADLQCDCLARYDERQEICENEKNKGSKIYLLKKPVFF